MNVKQEQDMQHYARHSWRKVGCAGKKFLRPIITFIIHLQNATNTEQIVKLQL